MSRYLLDTNILSNPTKPMPSAPLTSWLAEQPDEGLFIASMTVAEIWRAVQETPVGKRRTELERWYVGPTGPQSLFAGKILPFDEKAGIVWGALDGRRKSRRAPPKRPGHDRRSHCRSQRLHPGFRQRQALSGSQVC